MKILMVNKFFYIKGGSETYYFALKRKLEKEGHIVIDFSMKDKKNFESKYADYFVDNVDYSGSTSLINKLKMGINIIYSQEAKRKFEELIIKTKPEILSALEKEKMQAVHIDRVLDLNPEKVKQCMDAGLLQYRKRANEIVTYLMAKDDERTAVYREYEQGSISLEQVEEYEHQYQIAVQQQETAFKKVMLAVNDIEKAFSHGNPWLMKFRAISIPETLERTHLKEWLDHVWIVDFEQVEVILQESEWKRFFPEEWLNNGEEDCNGKKE